MQRDENCKESGLNAELKLEYRALEQIIELENLFVKKAKIYARLLTDQALAETMAELATEREQTAQGFLALLTGETDGAGTSGTENENREQGEKEE